MKEEQKSAIFFIFTNTQKNGLNTIKLLNN